jgi:Tfp pilus assembly protein PilF
MQRWTLKRTLFCLVAIGPIMGAPQNTPPPLAARDLVPFRVGAAAELRMPVAVPRGYAVVIGISSYQGLPKEDKLPFAEKDAENVYSTLISKEAGNIEYENVKKLIGPDATLKNIRSALEDWLPSKAQANDRVIVFFVGHGIVDSTGKGYLAPFDVDLSRIDQTGYPMERLGQVLSQNVKASWKVLLVDACHSGQITVNSTLERVNESLRGLPQGVLTLTSSHASENSFEDPALAGGNGVFSYYLVRGWLGDADVDPADGKVTADELVSYVKREVRSYARKQGRQQNPWDSGYFPDDLILGYSQQRRIQIGAQLPELENGSVIVEVNLDSVEVSMDGQRIGIANSTAHLKIPGLASGVHRVQGARMGYDPVSVEINVVPGTTQTVSLRFLHPRILKPAAKAYYDEGEEIWTRSKANAVDLSRAADRFSKAMKEDASFSAAALGLCRVQQAQNKTEDALKSCSKAVQVDSDYVEARTQYGILLLDTGDQQEAVRQLQRSATQDSQNPFVRSLFAEALYEVDRPKEAEAEADQAIRLDGSSAQAYLVRADARRVQKKFEEAAVDYHRALQLQEFGSGFLKVAGYWGLGTGMLKHRSGRRVLYRSQAAAAYFGLCACDKEGNDYHRAITNCKKALAMDRDDPDTYFLLAELYAELFNQDSRREYLLRTKENLEATLRVSPDLDKAPQLRLQLKEVNERLGQVR